MYLQEENVMLMKAIELKNKILEKPIIQGGMGVGISRSSLAGAVAKEGGMGVISSVQLGFDEPDFDKNPFGANLRSLKKHILRAKEIAMGNGIIGVNIMTATQNYMETVKTACKAGVEAIISGAGLPVDLPKYAEGFDVALAPIVSSLKSAKVILKYWDRKYNKTADFLVIEGPKAGGHLGFSREELLEGEFSDYDNEILKIIEEKKRYEEKYQRSIPVFVAGGIFESEDVKHAIELGADGVQVASRFVATEECDADIRYKQAYIDAKPEDIIIVKSPVGMPARAIENVFVKKTREEKEKITKCFRCLNGCNPSVADYCITRALINAVEGNVDEGLIFCGQRVGEIDKMTTVPELMKELTV